MAIIRSIVVRIAADISSLQQSLRDAESSLKSTGKRFTEIGSTLTAGLTVPILGIGIAMIKAGADFEAGMSAVKAVSGASADQMAQLTDLALKMGTETKYSATEAARGIEELIKAGVSLDAIIDGGLKGALALAAAGELELADAAEIASTALNAFKEDNLSVEQAADILAGAANASATSVEEMRYSLQMCSAVASAVGMSFKDTSVAIAVFAQNGLKGSDAGTSLKTMLMNLQPVTTRQIELFNQLGLMTAEGTSAFYDQNGELKSLAEISDLLQTSLSGMTDAQRLAAMEVMFGSDSIRAANILYKEGADGVNAMQKEMEKTTAAGVAAERLNNLKGALEKLKGALETIGITFAQNLLPSLRSAAEWFTGLAKKLQALSPTTQKVILVIAALAASIGPVLLIIGLLATGISAGVGALSMLISPVTAVIVAIIALGAVLAYFWNTNEEFRNRVIPLWDAIQQKVGEAIAAIRAWWDQNGPAILAQVEKIFNGIVTVMSTVYGQIWQSLQVLFAKAGPIWEQLKELFVTLGPVLEQLWVRLKPVLELIGGIILVLFGVYLGVLNGVIQALGPFIEAIINVVNIIVDVFGLVIALINGDWAAAWGFMKDIAKNAWELIQNLLETILGFIQGFVDGIISYFIVLYDTLVGASIIPDLVNSILSWFQNMVSGVTGLVDSLVNSVTGAFADISSNIENVVSSAWEWGSNLMTNLISGISSKLEELKDAASGASQVISDYLGFYSPAKKGAGSSADQWAPNLINMLQGGLNAGLPQINASLNAAFDSSALARPALAGMDAAGSDSRSPYQSLEHSGVIRVEGVNSSGELMGVTEILAKQLKVDQDRYASSPSTRRIYR